MTLNSSALMLPGQGYILINEPGSEYEPTIAELEAFAANTNTLPKGAKILGHTSRENLVAMAKDGGDSNVLGSWEQEQIETVVTSAATEYIDVTALQFDNSMFDLYYGGGDSSQAGRYAVPKNAIPPKKSICIVYLTRGQVVGQFFPHTSARGEDAMEHSVDNWSTIPIRFTILDPTDGGSRLVWIGRQFGPDATGDGTTNTTPSIASLNPTTAATGSTVTITGSNFTGATQVTFGTYQASYVVDSATQISATVPANATGTVDVKVVTPQGTSTASTFTVQAAQAPAPSAPTLTSLTPDTGAVAGGETVTLTGTGFTGATAVEFDGVAASSFTVDSDTQITATAPADADGVAGPVQVTVTNATGTSTGQTYTYA